MRPPRAEAAGPIAQCCYAGGPGLAIASG